MPRPKPPNAGKGRPKGSPNKVTAAAKEAYRLAFEQLGGVTALAAWAKDNPTEFYKLHARLIPHEVVGPGEGGAHVVKTIQHIHEPAAPS